VRWVAIECEEFAVWRVALALLLLVVVFVTLLCELPPGCVPDDEAAPLCGAVTVEEPTDGHVLSLICATPFAFVAEGFAPECC
jgi:hypothetical protein